MLFDNLHIERECLEITCSGVNYPPSDAPLSPNLMTNTNVTTNFPEHWWVEMAVGWSMEKCTSLPIKHDPWFGDGF